MPTQVEMDSSMGKILQTAMANTKPDHSLENRSRIDGSSEGHSIHYHNKCIWLGGRISTRSQADELIATVNALKPLLKENDDEVAASKDRRESDPE